MNSLICDAIRNKKLLQYYYNGGTRVVEPHCHGVTTAANEGLRAFQVSGYSESGKLGWKMFDLGNANNITKLDETFDGPRPGYRKGDKGMSHIYSEL
ncbi:MAG: hypothetical protein IPM32_09015 [Ignavibacteriae bacterium]|nr:hypothetical protein [Ignavibacteriota bacterium]